MFADAIRCTHNGTGGSSTITLAAQASYPTPITVFGSSGTMLVEYQIAEYTDNTYATLSKFESGIGSLVLSTSVLTRTVVLKTFTSGGSYNAANPTALSFGNTAANVIITFGGGANTNKNMLSSTYSVTSGGSDIWTPFDTRVTADSNIGTFTMTNGSTLFLPIDFIYARAITDIAMDVTTSAASSHIRVGLYDTSLTSGGPVNLLTEFTSSTQIDSSGTGFKSITMGTPWWMPAGFYWLCLQSDSSTVAVRRYTHHGNGLISTNNSTRDLLMFDKGGTYGALAATAPTSAATNYSRSGGGKVMVLYK